MRSNPLKVWSTLVPILLLAGFFLMAPLTLAHAATLQTDQPEYAIGDFATISGQGFTPGVTVTIEVERVDNVVDRTEVTAQPDGTFQHVYYLNPNLPDPDAAFRGTLTVRALVDDVIVATATFLDNPQWTLQGCSKQSGDCEEKNPGNDWAKNGNLMDGWTSGSLHDWYEGENVPYRLRVSLPKTSDGNKNYFGITEHDNLRAGITGIDAMSGFYVGAGPSSVYPEGYLTKNCIQRASGTGILIPTSGTPCYVSGPTYSGVNDDGYLGDSLIDEDPADGIDNDGDGRIDEDPPMNSSGPARMIQYTWAVHFDSGEAGNSKKRWAFYWKAHLAIGSNSFPGASLHADASPSGNQDVPIQQSNSCSSADLSVTKTDSPDPVSAGGTITYTIKVKNWGYDSASGVTVYDTLPPGTTFVSATGSGWNCNYSSGAVTCTRGSSLQKYKYAPNITIVVTAPSPGVDTTITNTAEVYWNGPDPNSSNDIDMEDTTVQAVPVSNADLSVSKSGPPDPGVSAGSNFSYAVNVSNLGPANAPTVTVTDTLPAGTTFVNAVGTGWTCNQSSGIVTCTRTNLGMGAAPAITITVTAPTPSLPTTVTNNVTVAGSGCNDPIVGNNSATAETIVSGIAELSIVKAESVDPVLVNGSLTYTLTVTNNGPSSATGVSVSDTLPAGVTFVSASGTGWTCGYSSGTVTCSRASLPLGTGPDITIAVIAPATAGSLSNTASVTAFELDTNTGDNSSTIGTTVSPAVDLLISKTDSPDPVNAQSTLTYTLSVGNAGPSSATGITVTDVLPAGTTYVSASGSGWACNQNSGTVTCTRASLGVASAPNITITVTSPAEGGVISNTATVSATETDTNAGNNMDTEGTTVTASANLSISKSDSPDPVTAGGVLTYTIVVSNSGPSTASNLTVSDTIPAGATHVSSGGSGWTCNNVSGTVTCTLPSLGVATAPNITITVTAPVAGGPISNTATVSATTGDPSPGNNSSTANTNVTASADLSVTKTDSPDPVTAGGTLTYTVSVSNAGPSTASSLTVTDTLPAGTSYVSAAGTDWTCNNVSGTVTCTRSSLPVGAAPNITITVTAPANAGGINNTVTVSAATNDPNGGNNSASATTSVTASADLSVTKTDSPDPVNAGATLTYTLTVNNAGPSNATGISVIDTLPSTVTYQSAIGTGWTCNQASGVVTCTRASLGVTTAPVITITVTAPANGGGITNVVTVSGAEADPDGGNNSDSEPTSVGATNDLSITKTDSPDPVAAGGTITYTITVNNSGPSSATNVTVTDTLPSGVTYQSASGTGWSCNEASGVVTCTRPTLTTGAAPIITINVTAPVVGSVLTNTAGVSATESDSNPANNSATATTVVGVSADLSITKADSPDPVLAGNTLTYTINVSNAGPSPATNVTVTDPLPAGVGYVSSFGTGWSCNEATGTVTCVRPTLSIGAAPAISIVLTAPVNGGPISNTATVSATQGDPNSANNSATAPTNVTASSDLSISKSDAPDPVNAGQALTYTLTAGNAGPSIATSVTVSDPLPAGTTFVSATGTGWTCNHVSGTVTCTMPSLSVSTAQPITIVVNAPGTPGTLNNTATVSSAATDTVPGNNSASTTTTVLPLTDLSITKTDNPDPVGVGLNVTYTITVTNNGPSGATGVTVTDTPGAGSGPFTFVSAAPSQGSCSTGFPMTCSLGNLSAAGSATITLVVSTSVAGMIGNEASVSGNENDLNMANNTVLETTNVGDVSRLIAISTRALVETGSNREIAGFIIGGNIPKQLIIRGRGPSMSSPPYNITGTLADPLLQVFDSVQKIAQNDDWQDQSDPTCSTTGYACGSASQIITVNMDPCMPNPGETVPPPNCEREAAVLITLPPGPYTAVLSGVNGGTGVGLVEVYDVDGGTLPKVVAISTRANVLTGFNRMIGGFNIGAGTGDKKVIIRARGPSLGGAPFNISGTLANPYFRLFSATDAAFIAQNDDWGNQSDPLCSSSGYVCGTPLEITATGMDPCVPNPGETAAPPNCGFEAAIVITLPPGAYTAVMSGVNDGTGVGLMEVYEISE